MESNTGSVDNLEVREISSYWLLCKEYSVMQAALLIIGCDPESETGSRCEDLEIPKRPTGYEAVKQAIRAALQSDELKGTIAPMGVYWDNEPKEEIPDSFDVNHSFVDRDSLVAWLAKNGFVSGYFFQEAKGPTGPEYLDQKHPRYAPKLAAAVNAWLAVTNTKGKTPKQALDKWLRENAARFGMVNDEGNPVEAAVTDCSKLANWEPGGGAPKTPGN